MMAQTSTTNDGLLDLADLDRLEQAAARGVPFGEAAKRIAAEKPKTHPTAAPSRPAPTTQQEIAAPRRNVEATSAPARGAAANRPEPAPEYPELNGDTGDPVVLQVSGATRTPTLAELATEETPAGFRMPPPLPIPKPDPPKPTRRARDEVRAERARTLAEVKRELAELRRDLGRGDDDDTE